MITNFINKNDFELVALIFFYSQLTFNAFSQQISQELHTFPSEILATRSIVLYDYSISDEEAETAQRAFAKLGIDATAYFHRDIVFSGYEPRLAFEKYFTSRQISFLVIFEKEEEKYKLGLSEFDPKQGLHNNLTEIYYIEHNNLNELLQILALDSRRIGKKENLLINEIPETGIFVNPIKGKRQDYYALDLKVDKLAIPKFGIAEMDITLKEFFEVNYPLKYEVIDSLISDKELRSKGFSYVLCYIHTRGINIKKLLEYDISKEGDSLSSVTYPNEKLIMKSLPMETSVYKFYFRHTTNGNVFVGPRWDADIHWLDALRNHILGFKETANIK